LAASLRIGIRIETAAFTEILKVENGAMALPWLKTRP
jgi:hypothetical protein